MIVILSFVQGCSPSTLVANDFCYKYDPVYTVDQDTQKTRDAANRNNFLFEISCPQ